MNIDDYCRLCASPRYKLLQIFDDEGFKLNILESINKCLKIEICEKDHLPRAVCLECSEKLTSTRKFIDASFEAQATLHQIFGETHLLKEENSFSFDNSLGDGSKHSTDSLVSVLEQEKEVPDKTVISIDDVDSSLLEEYVENLNNRNNHCLSNDHNFFRNESRERGDVVSRKDIPRAFSIFSHAESSIDKTSSSTKTESKNYVAVSHVDTELEISRVDENAQDASCRGSIRINKGVFKNGSAEEESRGREVVDVTDESESEGVGGVVKHAEAAADSSSSIESKPVIKVDEEKCAVVKKEKGGGRETVDCFDGVSWPCALCDHRSAKYDDLRSHYSHVHRVPMKYMCPLCSKTFVKSTNFYVHLKKHRPNFNSNELKSTKTKRSCDECSEEFPNRRLLDLHMAAHPDVRLFPCDDCGKSFRHQSLLQLHARCHLPVDLKNKFQCDLCDKRFSTKPNLITHRRIHLGVRNYTCDQCGKSFIQKGNLDAHMLTHSSDKPFACDICEKSFKTMLQLRKHHSVHTGAKPHQCDVCGRMFRERGTLREHYRIHTGAMPFSCEFCGKSFRFKGILTTHRRQHTGEKPYSCQECQHHFTNWPNYNKHMKRKHGINLSKTSRVKMDPAVSSDSLSKTAPAEVESLEFQAPNIADQEPFDQVIDGFTADHILSSASNFYNVTSPSSFSTSSYAHPFLNNGPLINFYNLSHLATSVAPMDVMGFGQTMVDVMASAHPQLR